jgi:uncharacterized protein
MTASKTLLILLLASFAIAALAGRRYPRPLAPAGFRLAKIAGVLPDEDGLHDTVVLIREPSDLDEDVRDFLPITVGGSEGASIALAVQKRSYPRPLTHDLLYTILNRTGVRVQAVFIHSLRNETFFARLELERGGQSFSLDCRPSDGLAMAARSGAPIWVEDKVYEKAAVKLPEGHGSMDPRKERVPL